MRFEPKDPPREFRVGRRSEIVLRDCGTVQLDADEQVTFTTPLGGEFDVARKSWGFYATPSLNGRLARFGLRGALIMNRQGLFFVVLVEAGCEPDFERYVASEELEVVAWLDDTRAYAGFRLGG